MKLMLEMTKKDLRAVRGALREYRYTMQDLLHHVRRLMVRNITPA